MAKQATKKKTSAARDEDFDPVGEIEAQIEPADQRGAAEGGAEPEDQTGLVTEKDGRTFRLIKRDDGGVEKILVSRGRKPEDCGNCGRKGTVVLRRVCKECKTSTAAN